jgi:hypothetical protein
MKLVQPSTYNLEDLASQRFFVQEQSPKILWTMANCRVEPKLG